MYLEFRNQLESLQNEVCNTPANSYLREARLLAQILELNDWDPIKNATLAQWAIKHPEQGFPVIRLSYQLVDQNTLVVIGERKSAASASAEKLVLFKITGLHCLAPSQGSPLTPKLLRVLTEALSLVEMRLVNYFMICFSANKSMSAALKVFNPPKALFRTQENLAKLAA